MDGSGLRVVRRRSAGMEDKDGGQSQSTYAEKTERRGRAGLILLGPTDQTAGFTAQQGQGKTVMYNASQLLFTSLAPLTLTSLVN